MPNRFSLLQEMMFRDWYSQIQKRYRLAPDPDDPLHHYDYRAAWMAGAAPGPGGHWPSIFKTDSHPNRYVPMKGGLLDSKFGVMVDPRTRKPIK